MRDGAIAGHRRWRVGRARVALSAAAVVALVAIGFIPVTTGTSGAAVIEAFLTVAPTSGLENTAVTVTQNGLWQTWLDPTTGARNPCIMSWQWNGAVWPTTGTGGTGQAGQAGHTAAGKVPASAVLGNNTITGVCSNPLTGQVLNAPTVAFTVKAPTWSLGDSPVTAVAGHATNVTLTGHNNAPGNPACNLTYSLDGHNVATKATPEVYALPTTTSVGAHTFKIVCSTGILAGSATVGFTVTPAPTTTTTAAPTTTARGATTTTARGATTTTVRGATTTTGSTSTSSGSSSSSSSVSIDTTPTTVPGQAPVTANTYLKLTALAIAPGAQVSANGKGCDARAPVALTIGSTPVGHTRATSSGAFHAPLTLGALSVGRYTVVARCGPILAAPLDIVLASQVSAATSTLAVIIFALLIGALAFRRQIFPRRPTPTPPSETEPSS